MNQEHNPSAFKSSLIRIRVLDRRIPDGGMSVFTRPGSEGYQPSGSLELKWKKLWDHLCGVELGKDHVVSLVRTNTGVEIYACCIGAFRVVREDIADPFMFETENAKDLLTDLCEYFSKINHGAA
jgi:hypothetical protein